jgi:hypothetical protein
MLNEFEDGSRSTTTMKIDLLLRHEDGTPIIGEAKVAKKTGYDTDSVLALIQGLAGATQFATPNHPQRLATCYPYAFQPGVERVDVAIVAYRPPVVPRASLQADLDRAARDLARSVTESPLLPPEIRHIWFLEVTGAPRSLSLRLL